MALVGTLLLLQNGAAFRTRTVPVPAPAARAGGRGQESFIAVRKGSEEGRWGEIKRGGRGRSRRSRVYTRTRYQRTPCFTPALPNAMGLLFLRSFAARSLIACSRVPLPRATVTVGCHFASSKAS